MMLMSTIKDKVITASVKGTPYPDIDKRLIHAALEELAKEVFLESIDTSVTGTGHVKVYERGAVYPKAYAFVELNKSFRCQAFWQWVSDFPKNYWFVILLIGSLSLNIKELIRYFLG